ncbi:hypothetical protein GGH94_002586 [Coemansia aciculifera]|uniref:Uncharacterized protein n=1 Tax=Coemansia aciculifera TaxID=417176 RepID=A0A9W8M6L2_9FUNG|nr:hypothetical protein GGH94_002586 [Coemansia aciculifera]
MQTRSNRTTITESNAVSNEQTSDEDDDAVEPLASRRLDDIRREVCAIKTTWADLRQLYPPKQSGFAPLAEVDDDLEIDDALSQAATMAAYGVELLLIALGNPKVNRRLTRQAYRLFATLCATLVGTGDRHRTTSKAAEEEFRAVGRVGNMDAVTPKLAGHSERGKLTEGSRANKRKGPDYLDSSGSDSDSSSSSLWPEHRRHGRRKKWSIRRKSKPHPQSTVPVASVSDLYCADHRPLTDDTSAANAAAAAEESELVVSHGRINQLRRQVVIRNALLRQGLSESEVITYFDQWAEGTNRTYDSEWGGWVHWCGKQSLDPLKRSEHGLDAFVSEGTRSKASFQLLPNHAIERIVDHVTGSSRVLFDGVKPNSNEYRTMLRPLLSVCHGFRAIALARYCGFCKLELASSHTFKKLRSRASKLASVYAARNIHYSSSDPHEFGYRLLNDLGHPTHHLAKELIIELDEDGVYSGEALRMLTHAPYEGCALPQTRKLTFSIFMDVTDEDYDHHVRDLSYKRRRRSKTSPSNGMYDSYASDEDDDAIRPNVDKTTDPSVLEANISAFVQRIRQMTPRVVDIEVLPKPFHYGEESRGLYGSLLQLNQICNLVHISFDIELEPNPFVLLAQRSALTLQSLSIGHNSYVGLEGIIQETEGNYVAYPRLHMLKLFEMHRSDSGDLPTCPGVVPFPSLRHLHMDICHPFGDDTIFRGNTATLEYLKIELDYRSYHVFSEYGVFTPVSHPKLQCVDITFFGDGARGPDLDAADYLEYVLNIGSQATVRTINGHMDDNELALALYLFEDFACIRVLSLPGLCWLEFVDVIELIKSLPLLSDLTTSPTQLKLLPEDVTVDEFPEFMITVFAGLNDQFRCWSFMQTGVGNEVVRSVLLLALVCPNFSYAVPLPAERKEFMKLMEETIATDYFQEYTPSLRRLLFDGWNVAMQLLSAFQLLPPHIVKLIVDHVAFSSRLVYEGFDDDDVGSAIYMRPQGPLLWVCHNFRAFVYERFCKRYRLDIFSNEERPRSELDFWPYRYRNPDHHTHHIAKELTFNFDAWAVYSGKALAQMSMAPFEGCPFPQVRELMITLYMNPEAHGSDNCDDDASSVYDCHHPPVVTEDYPLETAANTTAFVRRLKQMVPGVNKVDVKAFIDFYEEVLLENCSVHDMGLARQLFGIADIMVAITSGRAPLFMYMDLEPLRSLVRIDINSDGYADVIVPINTGVGDYLEYLCLHTLKIYPFNGYFRRERPVFPGAVPFSNIRHLTLWSRYPFGDDVPFRGNAATLMYLNMVVDLSLMIILCNHDVFTPTSHPKLHCVIIDSLGSHTTLEPAVISWHMWFAFAVGPEAPVREFDMPKFGNYLLGATPLHSKLANIQALLLTCTALDLWEVFALVKLLPLLSDLTTLPVTYER